MLERSLSIATVSLALSISTFVVGCGDNHESTDTTASGGSTATGSGAAGGTAGTGGTGGEAGGPGAVEVVAAFDPNQGQFVEGLDIGDGVAYVGALLTGQVYKVDLANPTIEPFGNMPAFAQNSAAMVGLTVGPDKAVYACFSNFAPGGPPTGVYRIDPTGGEGTLVASDPSMVFCNDLRFDSAGDLFVSDSMGGAIFKVEQGDGAVTKWSSDPLLTPDPTICGYQTDFHLGVNGIVPSGDAWFAVNTDRGSIVKIPLMADGSAGAAEVFVATDCAALSGVDGLVVEPKSGDLLIAVNYLDKIVRVSMQKDITLIAEGEPLQSPASLAFDSQTGDLYVTNAAFAALAVDPSKAKPSLAKVPLP